MITGKTVLIYSKDAYAFTNLVSVLLTCYIFICISIMTTIMQNSFVLLLGKICQIFNLYSSNEIMDTIVLHEILEYWTLPEFQMICVIYLFLFQNMISMEAMQTLSRS